MVENFVENNFLTKRLATFTAEDLDDLLSDLFESIFDMFGDLSIVRQSFLTPISQSYMRTHISYLFFKIQLFVS